MKGDWPPLTGYVAGEMGGRSCADTEEAWYVYGDDNERPVPEKKPSSPKYLKLVRPDAD